MISILLLKIAAFTNVATLCNCSNFKTMFSLWYLDFTLLSTSKSKKCISKA